MATKIQIRRDTSENWNSLNPTLSLGELGFETNTGKFKIGNGSSAWTALDYFLDSSDIAVYLTAASASTIYATKAELANVDLSGYLTESSASTIYATKTELDNIDLSSASAAAVAAIVDSAPATLNTLNELAAALNDDANFSSTVTTSLGNKLDASSASTTYLSKNEASNLFPSDVVTVEEKLASSFKAAASSFKVFKVDGAESTIAATAAAEAELKSIFASSVLVAYVVEAEVWVR